MVLTLAVVTCITAYVAWIARTRSSANRVAASPTPSTESDSNIQQSTIKASDGLQAEECATLPELRPSFAVQHSADPSVFEYSDSLIETSDDFPRVNEPVGQVAEAGGGILCDSAGKFQDGAVLIVNGNAVDGMRGSVGTGSEGSDSRIENANDSTRANEPVGQVAEMGVGIFCDFASGYRDGAVLIVTGKAVDGMRGPVGTNAEKGQWCLDQMRLVTEHPKLCCPSMLNEKGWLRKEYYELVTLSSKTSRSRTTKVFAQA